MSIRPLQSADLKDLLACFQSFPFKTGQQRFQKLDGDKLAERFLAPEAQRLDKLPPDKPMQWVGIKKEKPCCYAALHPDAWHSGIYGISCGRIAPFLTHLADPALRLELLDTVLDAAQREGFHHLSARIDGSEYPVLNAFAQRGFYPVDCSVKMAGWLSQTPRSEPVSASGMCVRRYRADDLPVLQKIAANEHPYNHYYNDPHLPREATGRLFEGWVERCCNGLSSDVFVLDASGEPKGFVIYLEPVGLNRDMGTRLAILDFVCLDPSVRGGGLGRRFIAETLQALGGRFNMVELRTSQNNYPAMACYMDLGLRITSTDFVLHGIL